MAQSQESGDDEPFYQGMLDSNQEFQEGDLGEAVLEGRCGFHTFYSNGSPVSGTQTAMHKALNRTLEMAFVDTERAEERFGEATPATVADVLDDEIEATVGHHRFAEQFVEEFERALMDQIEEEEEDGN